MFGRRKGTQEEHDDLAAIQVDYHNTFATPHGKRVLEDILRMFGFFEHDPEFPELRLAAIMLLDRAGWTHEENIPAIVDGIIKAGQVNEIVPVEQDEKEITWRQRTRPQK